MKKILFIFLFHTFLFSSTLNLSISSNPSRINPILSTDSASSEIADWIFNGLFKYDKDGNIVEDLALSYTFETPTILLVSLKKNIFWHDGVQFTAHDVHFTFEMLHNPKIYTPRTQNFKKVKKVEVLDDFTLKIIYKEPYFKALEIWMLGMVPKHILENEKDIMTSSFNKKPIGTGAYKLEELKISQDIVLEVNNNFFGKVPKIEKIHYKFVPDTTTAFYLLKQKQLDIGGLNPIQLERQLDTEFEDNFNIFEKPSFAYTYMGFNLKSEKFQNKKIREAISLAIDKQEIIDILFFGHASLCNGPFLPDTFAFNKNVVSQKPDLERSKQLLEELGYDEKNRFSFTVITNANNPARVNVAQILQHQLAKIGIDMKIRVVEWQAFLNTVVTPRKFDAVILGWGLALMPDARSIWHSSSDVIGGFNFVGYKNEAVDLLIENGERTIEIKELGKIYQQMFQTIVEDIPYIFFYIPNTITAVNKNIQNVKPTLMGIMHNQEEWIKNE